ncbi:MAG: hypothetical protein RR202_06975 [Bacteroidales bacterium]
MKNKIIYSLYYLNVITFILSLLFCVYHFLSVDVLSSILACGGLIIGILHVQKSVKHRTLLIKTLNHNNFMLLLMMFIFTLLFLGMKDIALKTLMINGFVSVLLNLLNGSSTLPVKY